MHSWMSRFERVPASALKAGDWFVADSQSLEIERVVDVSYFGGRTHVLTETAVGEVDVVSMPSGQLAYVLPPPNSPEWQYRERLRGEDVREDEDPPSPTDVRVSQSGRKVAVDWNEVKKEAMRLLSSRETMLHREMMLMTQRELEALTVHNRWSLKGDF